MAIRKQSSQFTLGVVNTQPAVDAGAGTSSRRSIDQLPQDTSINGVSRKMDPAINYPSVTPRREYLRMMATTSQQDLQQLRQLLSPEYDTLAAYKDRLLEDKDAQEKFFLIHESTLEVHPDLDSALEQGNERFYYDLFFVGRVRRSEIETHLKA